MPLLTFKFNITVGFSQGKIKLGSMYGVVMHTCKVVTDLQQIIFCTSHVLVSMAYFTSCATSKTSPIPFWGTSSRGKYLSLNTASSHHCEGL